MAYINFARKYRPQTFDEIIGQEHICRTLKNAIKSGRVSHAYLFTGSRGIGKTSTARILAKALNCQNPTNYNPCNRCQNCIEITEGRSLDVSEIDGASNRGIDQIRDLRENVKYPPANSRYRIFIIDEVHMLTKEAFNALLKTLEEPPPHVVFIFATTEPMKVPPTILSRCQRFDFHRIPVLKIVEQLKKIANSEKVNVSDDILLLIAKKADGSLRDAESLFDQVVAFSEESPKIDEVQKLLGIIDSSYFFKTGTAISNRNLRDLLGIAEEIYQNGISPFEYLAGLTDHFRTLLAINVGGVNEALDLPENTKSLYQEEAKFWKAEDLVRVMKILTDALAGIKGALNQKTYLETVLLRLGMLDKSVSITELLRSMGGTKISISRTKSAGDADIFDHKRDSKSYNEKASGKALKVQESVNKSATVSIPGEVVGPSEDDMGRIWHTILAKIHETNPSLSNFLEHGKPVKFDGNTIEIRFYRDSEFHYKNIKQRSTIVEKAIGEVLGKSIKLKLHLIDEGVKEELVPGLNSITNMVMDVFDGEIVKKREEKSGKS